MSHPEYSAPGAVHYGMTQDEMRAKTKSNGCFEGPMPLCGNGSFHCTVTRDKAKVTCEPCRKKLNLKPE